MWVLNDYLFLIILFLTIYYIYSYWSVQYLHRYCIATICRYVFSKKVVNYIHSFNTNLEAKSLYYCKLLFLPKRWQERQKLFGALSELQF